MRPTLIMACAVTGVLGLVASSLLSEAGAAPRSKYKYSGRTGAYLRYQGYPRPYCNFAIAEYQRRWPYQLWPPSMRCFPYN
jgi:hypothetical protein